MKPMKAKSWLRPLKRRLGAGLQPESYIAHPDPRQEEFFFGLLRECLDNGTVSDEMRREEMRRNHVRHDALELLERAAPPGP
jgi:hypothetical protein